MPATEAQIRANRENARKSTGPKTFEGKARSRCNALKHGLAGAGVALPGEDAAEIARRFDGLQAQFHPETPMGAILVHRVAFLSVRLERCAEQEAAHLGEKIRHAKGDHDEARQLEVARLLGGLGDDPAASVRRLLRTPKGTEALIAAWLGLKADLVRASPRFWTAAHCERANLLTGRRMDDIPVSRINELSNAVWGEFEFLAADEGAGLAEKARRAWAKQRLIGLIDEEVEALRRCFEGLDHEAFEADREEAPKRALFDASKPATLARRYESAAERGMFRALKELRRVEREAAEDPSSPQACQAGSLGSFGADETGPTEGDDEPSAEPERSPATPLDRPTIASPRPAHPENDPTEARGRGIGPLMPTSSSDFAALEK